MKPVAMNENDDQTHRREPTFAPFPTKGIWTAVGMSRTAFFVILTGSIGLYLLWGGPLWSHLGQDDFERIVVSYAAIPIAVAVALAREKTLGIANFLGASFMIGVLKLVVTALLALVFDL